MANDVRIALVGIIVAGDAPTHQLNAILSNYGNYIIGRMGVPHRGRGLNIISVAMDAPQDVINAVAGKIGSLSGISVKITYAPVTT